MEQDPKAAKTSFSGTRSLLFWCRQQTESYNDVNVYNMSTSWRDGLAFCAIIHRYRPDLIEFERLSKENIMENNEIAFSLAEKHFGIPIVLDAGDMVENVIPDKLSVITYVSQLYEYFKNKTPANQGYSTKMNIQPKARSDSTGHKGSKRISPSHQIYLLSGHAKRVATALRNVFKSDAKEESTKSKEHGQGSKYLSVEPLRTSLETNRSTDELVPSAPRKSPMLGNDCFICHNRVFLMERLIAERKLFHRACFRCDKCRACLRPGTYHYFPDTKKFCCLFDCPGGQKENPIKIKLEPLTNAAQQKQTQKGPSLESSPNLSDSSSTKLSDKSPLQRQFSVVKKNAITLAALPQPLTRGKPRVVKSPKQSRSSQRYDRSKVKKIEQGEKKRRFSGGGRLRKKREGKGKYFDSEELGDKENSSWSPENKRRAPDISQVSKLNESDSVKSSCSELVNKTLSVEVPYESSETSSPKLLLESKEQQEEEVEKLKQKSDDQRSTKDPESPSVNLFFSFKEELLKRATEGKGSIEDDKVSKKGDTECVSPEFLNQGHKTKHGNSGTGDGDSLANESDSQVNASVEENLEKPDNQHKFSESSVQSDSTKSTKSQKTSVSEETEPSAAAKSVQRLREKFLKINDMIDEKHKNNVAKKSVEIQRELRCISAWKQQTEAHQVTSRKHSIGSGKAGEVKKPSFGTSRRSVKELRKMYMDNGSSGRKSVKGKSDLTLGKSDLVSSKSSSLSAGIEQKSSITDKTADFPLNESKKKHDSSEHGSEESTEPADDRTSESKDENNSSDTKDVEFATLPGTSTDSMQSIDTNDNIVIINVDHTQVDESVSSDSQISGEPHATENDYSIAKSDQVSSEVPSLQVDPASPQSPNSERHSPGLKRHSASHDSGIDMPLYTQSNFLSSLSADDKISARNLKVAAEFSFSGSDSSVSPTEKQMPNENMKDLQISSNPSSPVVGYSPEIQWSLPLSNGHRASLSDSSSSCSSPRMSIIIAQEASTTKINSRFFTVETMEPRDLEYHRIAEEYKCVMEVEGEFCFGRENSRTSRAERDAIFSLRNAKNRSCNSTDLIKEEEITLSPAEIDAELQSLEVLHGELERRGVEIEHNLRESMDSERPFNDCEEELLRDWLGVVHERNVILRRESELIYLLQSHNYEERYRTVEGELRKLVAMRDEVKSSDDLKRERELLSELLELVQKRSFIVDSLEEERVREIHEDEKVEQALTDGIVAVPEKSWDQRPDCTKVAFSRFYC